MFRIDEINNNKFGNTITNNWYSLYYNITNSFGDYYN